MTGREGDINVESRIKMLVNVMLKNLYQLQEARVFNWKYDIINDQ
jgi:hypothetical protein